MRTELTSFVISPAATLLEAMQAIDDGRLGIALVVDAALRLQGTVTDGDARRAVLRRTDLSAPVDHVMNRKFIAVGMDAREAAILELMHARSIKQIPVVDRDGALRGLHYLPDLSQVSHRPNWAVIMAGGEGRRLRPLTERTPKAMLPIGEQPILRRVVDLLVRHRFREIFISVNYLGDQIEDYFGDGGGTGCRISYLRETKPLGTAGALSLLPSRPTGPLLVINGDLVTDLDISALMDYHTEAACLGTQCVFEYVHHVPFGVVRCEENQVIDHEEKPSVRQLVNAGIYVISPSLLDLVPDDHAFTMPDLLVEARRNGYPIAAFPIRERWADIGQLKDYEQVREEWRAARTEVGGLK
jgi:dTDP-glucose pyrophosphorylase